MKRHADDVPLKTRRAALGSTGLACAAGLLTLAALLTPVTKADQPLAAREAMPDGTIILFRHATAPGGGDPEGFRLGDCATQRNLDAQGREQARRIGEQLRSQSVPVTAVWTSQWCRTRETAALAWPRLRAIEQPAFNSFFGDRSKADAQTRQAQALLQGWRGPGVLVVTTHQVNITALTGVTPTSGEGVVLRVVQGDLRVVGRITAPAGAAP